MASLVAKAVTPAVGDLLNPGTSFAAGLPGSGNRWGRAPDLPQLLREDAWDRLDEVVGQPPAPGAETVAVIVCTRDRPEQLARCLESLAGLQRRPDELVVVDNGRGDDATRSVALTWGARLVHEPRPGLSRARNTGIAATTSELIAFTDDDVVVHPGWLGRLCAAFTTPDVMATTGLVLPLSLGSEAQQAFEGVDGGFGQGFRPREFGQEWLLQHRRRSAHVWKVGAGASAAFRRGAFDRVGGFDPRLGAGSAGCSEDSELWHRLLAGGWRCRYEPWAVVHHNHRDTVEEHRVQSRAYLRGHVAALAVQWTTTRQRGEPVRALSHLPRHFVKQSAAHLVRRKPRPVLRAEVSGYLRGLVSVPAVLRSRDRPPPPLAPVDDGPVVLAPLADVLAHNPFPHPLTLGSFYGEKLRAIHAISPERGVQRVVEVGGGQSGLAAALYPDAQVLTVDLERTYGQRTDLYGSPGRSFVCADATRLPLGDGCVDVVTLFDVAEHIPDDATALKEALRVLRPGGHLLLSTPSELWKFPAYSAYRRWTPTDQDVMDEWGHVRRGYRVAELNALVGRAHDAFATFITPVSVLAHDLSFSHLGERKKRALGLALAPLTRSAVRWHAPHGAGLEVALRWTVP
jgi:GT2 family glycosyltransferase/SAM-dependent methyltransferase